MTPELKPCPFCGGAGEKTPHSEVPDLVIVGCADSDCIGHAAAYDFADLASAAKCWNTRASAPPVGEGWQPIETAPKDGTWIVALVAGADDRWEHLNGRAFVVRHEGKTASDYDLGWALHPGFGGVHESWFTHWMPLPKPPASSGEA